MPTLESVDVQSMHQWSEDKNVLHLSQDTSWLSPKRASTIQEMDPLQRGLTFNIQTSPLSVLVQPTNPSSQSITAHKSESPTRSANPDGAKHDSMRRANSEALANGLRKPLSIILMASQSTTQDTLQSNGSSNDSKPSLSDSLPVSVGNVLVDEFAKVVNGGLSTEHTNPPHVDHVPLSSPNDLWTSTSVPGGVSEEPSSNILTKSRAPSLAQNTTAEAATLALNAAFKSQSVAGPQGQRTSFLSKFRLNKPSIPGEVTPFQISIQPRAPIRVRVELSNTLHKIQEFQELPNAKPKAHHGSRMSQTRWIEPVLAENLRGTYTQNVSDSQSQDKPNHSKKSKSVHFKTYTSHEAQKPKKDSPKKLFLEAVVIPKRPPFSPQKVSSRHHESEPESESEQQDEGPLVTKTGPPKGPVRIRKPDVFPVKKAEQLEAILEANVATFGIASDEEVEEASASIVANYEILKSQLQSKEPVKDESHIKAPTVAYPRSRREDRFVDGIESALGPGSLFRIPKKLPKRIHSRVKHVGYVYTSSEPEESEIEPASDIPTEDEQGEEAAKLDTTRSATAKNLATPDDINGMKSSHMEIDEDDIEDDTNGAEVVGSLKRKLSSGPEVDKQSRRTHPRLEDNFISPKRAAATVDGETIARWVASLEMLIKGKVKMGRQELREVKAILDDIYLRKQSLDEQILETSQLKRRIRQLSELAMEDIPYNDEQNLRQRGRMINRFWA